MPDSISLDPRRCQSVGRDRRRHVNASCWLGIARGARGEERKHDACAGIIQIKFDSMISEHSSLSKLVSWRWMEAGRRGEEADIGSCKQISISEIL